MVGRVRPLHPDQSRVLNAGRDLRNGRRTDIASRLLRLLGAQRWSRSEKWSAIWSGLQARLFLVLNAGRDLRNGRPPAVGRCRSLHRAQRWSRSEKWSAMGTLKLTSIAP